MPADSPARSIADLRGTVFAFTDPISFSGRVYPTSLVHQLGELADAFNVMTADLARADAERQEREQMRAFYLRQIIAAQEEERKRIARELHDETGQALASVMVGLRKVEDAPSDGDLHTRLADLREVASATLENVRRLALELRPSALDDLGLAAALRRYAAEYTARFKIAVDVQIVGLEDRRLAAEIETALYRIVQEALTNVAKYANATHVSVLLERGDRQLTAIIEDNGCGFEAEETLRGHTAENRLGLYGMRERAELIGGTLTVESQMGCGTTVYVRISEWRISEWANGESANQRIANGRMGEWRTQITQYGIRNTHYAHHDQNSHPPGR